MCYWFISSCLVWRVEFCFIVVFCCYWCLRLGYCLDRSVLSTLLVWVVAFVVICVAVLFCFILFVCLYIVVVGLWCLDVGIYVSVDFVCFK